MEQEPKNANHNMKAALYGGLSVAIGLTLYAAFQYDASIRELALHNMPIDQAGQLLGGHVKDFVFVPMVAAGVADMGDIMAYTAGFAVALLPAALMHFASRNKRG